jgi:glycosyltransferase involved in cell wall biosynthesis
VNRPRIEHWLGDSVDVVHAMSLGYPVPTAKPSVVTVHDIGPLTHPEMFRNVRSRWMKIGLRHVLQESTTIISVSEATANELETYAGRSLASRLHVIHEGIAPHFFSTPDPACLQGLPGLPPGDTPFLLAVGGICPRKNLLRVVEALEKLASEVPHHLVLAGGKNTGWDMAETLRRFRESPIANRIHHVGYVSEEQLIALYNAATALVFVSLFEGFGLPLVEAFAAGCPVVTSNISSPAEIAGEAALQVNPYDVSTIAEALHAVCSDDQLRQDLRSRGRQRAQAFNWDVCADRVAAVYRNVA